MTGEESRVLATLPVGEWAFSDDRPRHVLERLVAAGLVERREAIDSRAAGVSGIWMHGVGVPRDQWRRLPGGE